MSVQTFVKRRKLPTCGCYAPNETESNFFSHSKNTNHILNIPSPHWTFANAEAKKELDESRKGEGRRTTEVQESYPLFLRRLIPSFYRIFFVRSCQSWKKTANQLNLIMMLIFLQHYTLFSNLSCDKVIYPDIFKLFLRERHVWSCHGWKGQNFKHKRPIVPRPTPLSTLHSPLSHLLFTVFSPADIEKETSNQSRILQ